MSRKILYIILCLITYLLTIIEMTSNVWAAKPDLSEFTNTLAVYVDENNLLKQEAADSEDEIHLNICAYQLTDEERSIAEAIVMGEAEGESYEGKVLVAQCLLNACLLESEPPSVIRTLYGYAGWNNQPSEEVKKAVKAVFDEGYKETEEEILFFYNPKYCYSKFHESQRYILTEGNHKFFAKNQ